MLNFYTMKIFFGAEDGIDPGTTWEDVPEDWLCPECGVGKEDFDMIEIT